MVDKQYLSRELSQLHATATSRTKSTVNPAESNLQAASPLDCSDFEALTDRHTAASKCIVYVWIIIFLVAAETTSTAIAVCSR